MPAHRRVDVQPHVLASGRSRRSSGVGSNAIDEWCRGWRTRRTAPGRRRGRRRSSRRGRRVASRTSSSCGTMRMRSVPMPAMRRPFSMLEWACGGGVGDEPRGVAVGVDRAVGRPPAGRQDRRRASPRSPSPGSRRRRARSSSGTARAGRAARPSSRASASRARCTPGEVTQLMPCTPSPADSSSPRIDGYDVFAGK